MKTVFCDISKIGKHYLIVPVLMFVMAGCGTRYKVTSSPADTVLTVENVETQTTQTIGQTPFEFSHESNFGDGFVLVASKEGFKTQRHYVSKDPGSTSKIHLVLEPVESTDRGPASVKEVEDFTEKMLARIKREQEELEKIRIQQEQEKFALMEKSLNLQIREGQINTQAKLETLNRTLDVYKDTVFSERFAKRAFYPQDEKRTEIKAALLARAQDRVSRSDFDGAKQLVTRLLEMDEYQPQAHSLKGTIAHKEGRVEESIRHWERALELDPQQPRTREYLVEAYQKAGRPLPKNIAEDERLLQREPAFATSSPDPLKVKLRDP